MPFFAANISYLWAELPYLDRFDAAAEAGFKGVEVLFPYDVPAPETLSALKRNGLTFVLLNSPPPNYTGGERGYAAVPGLEGRFNHDMRRAYRYATMLKAEFVHVMAGRADGASARDTFVANLKSAVDMLPPSISLTIEPLSPVSFPDYFLNDFELAAEIIDAVGQGKIGLQYDTYHAQEVTGDAIACFRRYRDLITHVQLGDSPGRVAPGLGCVDFPAFFECLSQTGYSGWCSAEYKPEKRTEDSLGWRPK